MRVQFVNNTKAKASRRSTHLASTALCSIIAIGTLLSGLSVPTSAMAQEAEDGSIVVTARRREEVLQNVPLSITALSAERLRESGASNLNDISQLTPGLTINAYDAESQVNPVIRGQSNLATGSADPSVSIFWDGIYLANGSAANIQQLDLQRVEVVKGPVSALYGRNSYSGALNYVSKPATDDLAFEASATIGSFGQQKLRSVIGGALIENVLRARLAAGIEKSDGGYVDQVNGARGGGYKKRAIQLTISFDPAEAVKTSGRIYYGNDTFGNSAQKTPGLNNNCGARSTNALNPGTFTYYCGNFAPERLAFQVDTSNSPGFPREANSREVVNAMYRIDVDAGMVDITSLTGYNNLTIQRFTDYFGLRNGAPFLLTDGRTVNLHFPFGSRNELEDFSEDIRISTKPDKPFRASVGGAFYTRHGEDTTLNAIDGRDIPAGAILASTAARPYITADGSASTSAVTRTRTRDRQYSGFASAEYDLLENLTLNGEFRRTRQWKELDSYQLGSFPGVIRPLGAPISNGIWFNNYRGSVTWKPTSDITLYASIANGTKGPGFNARAELESERAYRPERNTTYEAGIKSFFFDRKVMMNLSVYHIRARDLQLVAPSDKPTQITTVIKNFGGVDTDGFEMEFFYKPSKWFDAFFGAAYANPKFTKGTYDFSLASVCLNSPAYCDASRVVQVPVAGINRTAVDLSGLQLPEMAKWQLNATLNMRQPAPFIGQDWLFFATFDGRYESRQYGNQLNVNWFGPRKVVDLRGGFRNDNISIYAWVKNALQDQTPTNSHPSVWLNNSQQYWTVFLPTPRSYGLTMDYKF